MEPRCKSDYLTVRQQGSRRGGVRREQHIATPYSTEEIAKKNRNEPFFRRLTNFLESWNPTSERVDFGGA